MLARLLAKVSLLRRRRGFHSRHGGLWTDRLDAGVELERRAASGAIPASEAELLRKWMRDGYVILPRAVDPASIDRVVAEVDALWARSDTSYTVEIGGQLGPLAPEKRALHTKLVDLYARSAAALELALDPGITRFLARVFERDVLLFQSLGFERGSGDPVHQDSAYVVVDSPLEFAAAWIALEDIRPGSGELEYYPGSHRLSEEHFRGGWRNWNGSRHTVEERGGYLERLHTRARTAGLELERFLARKGDVLIWSADLAHGGSAIVDRSLSRKSLVCHYCPRGVSPYYWFHLKHSRTVKTLRPGAHFTSAHYALG